MSVQVLLSAVTSAPTTGSTIRMGQTGSAPDIQTYQATVSGTGAVSATVIVEGSNDGAGFVTMGTITLTDTTTDTDGFAYTGPWQFVRARLTAISGTGAAVTAIQGIGR